MIDTSSRLKTSLTMFSICFARFAKCIELLFILRHFNLMDTYVMLLKLDTHNKQVNDTVNSHTPKLLYICLHKYLQ